METEQQRLARHAARDVVDKLGIRPSDVVLVRGAAPDTDLVERVRKRAGRQFARVDERADVALYWPRTAREITAGLKGLRKRISEEGGIWVISAKRGQERPARPYLGNDVIALGLAARLVDNKVCSVSDADTAMRFVIRRVDRKDPR